MSDYISGSKNTLRLHFSASMNDAIIMPDYSTRILLSPLDVQDLHCKVTRNTVKLPYNVLSSANDDNNGVMGFSPLLHCR